MDEWMDEHQTMAKEKMMDILTKWLVKNRHTFIKKIPNPLSGSCAVILTLCGLALSQVICDHK